MSLGPGEADLLLGGGAKPGEDEGPEPQVVTGGGHYHHQDTQHRHGREGRLHVAHHTSTFCKQTIQGASVNRYVAINKIYVA